MVKHLEDVIPLGDEVTLYQMVRVQVKKLIAPPRPTTEEHQTIEERLNALVDSHLETKDPINIYEVAGIEKPDIRILEEDFLKDTKGKAHEDLRLKLLKKLLEDHITVNFRQGSPKERVMREFLEKTINDYHHRIIQAADVVRMMVKMKKDVDQEAAFPKDLGLNDEEAEFYKAITALELDAFDHQFLADLIHKVVKELKKNLSVDWTSDHRRNIYAKVKLSVKRVLLREKITDQQLEFITNAIMKEAERQYKHWPREATLYGIIRGKPPAFFDGNAQAFTGLYFNLETEEFSFYMERKMKGNPAWISVTKLMQTSAADVYGDLLEIEGYQPDKIALNRLSALDNIKTADIPSQEITGEDKTVDIVVDIFNKVISKSRCSSRFSLSLSSFPFLILGCC